MLHGMGPRTLKSVALASEVIHGDSTRFDDPARFSFAVGGKDGVPHPINVKALDETIEMLQTSVEKSKVGDREKSKALKRLHTIAVQGESKGTPLDFLKDFIDRFFTIRSSSFLNLFFQKVSKFLFNINIVI